MVEDTNKILIKGHPVKQKTRTGQYGERQCPGSSEKKQLVPAALIDQERFATIDKCDEDNIVSFK